MALDAISNHVSVVAVSMFVSNVVDRVFKPNQRLYNWYLFLR